MRTWYLKVMVWSCWHKETVTAIPPTTPCSLPPRTWPRFVVFVVLFSLLFSFTLFLLLWMLNTKDHQNAEAWLKTSSTAGEQQGRTRRSRRGLHFWRLLFCLREEEKEKEAATDSIESDFPLLMWCLKRTKIDVKLAKKVAPLFLSSIQTLLKQLRWP